MDVLSDLLEKLRHSKRITVLTGSGISAESGIPTFREAQTGLWARYDPSELATPEAFRRNPELVWNWYAWRRNLIRAARPNAAHFALVGMEQKVQSFTLITQNVDDLHRLAGNRNLIELHGNIHRSRCFEEGRLVEGDIEIENSLPHCPHCGGLLRPDVVWFQEPLPANAVRKAVAAAQNCEIFFSIGTSGMVEPAASLGFLAHSYGADLVEINPAETPLSPYTRFIFREPAGEILPQLVKRVWLN